MASTNDRQFDHFWQSYGAAQAWIDRHHRTVAHINSLGAGPVPFLPPPPPPELFFKTKSERKTKAKRRKLNTPVCEQWKHEDNTDQEERAEIFEPSEEEMSQDMIAFFRKTALHKIEREKEKRKLMEAGLWFVATSEDFAEPDLVGKQAEASVLPPTSRHEERGRRAKVLYGEASERLVAMEALLRMKFNEEQDRSKPALWPNIPLKL